MNGRSEKKKKSEEIGKNDEVRTQFTAEGRQERQRSEPEV